MRAAAAALSLVGCGPPCLPLADVPIRIEGASGSDTLWATLRDRLDAFDRWTAGATCVSEIQVEADGLAGGDIDAPLGRYRMSDQRIELDGRLPPSTSAQVLHHELCHAWDHREGWASRDRDDLFPADALPEAMREQGYRSDWDAGAEHFALRCETGPVLAPLFDAMDEAGCAVLLDAPDRWIQDRVYTHPDPSAIVRSGVAAVSVKARAVDVFPPETLYQAAFSGDALWALVLEHAPTTWVLWRVPLDGAPATRHTPVLATDPLPDAMVVNGVDEGLLRATWGPDGGLVWALGAAPDPWFEPWTGGWPSYRQDRWRRDGSLWFAVADTLWQQRDGELLPRRVAQVPSDDRAVLIDTLHPLEAGFGFVGSQGGRAVVGRLDGPEAPGGGTFSWAPATSAAAALPDGRRVMVGSQLSWGLASFWDIATDWRERPMLFVEAPDGDGWQLAPCGDGGLPEGGRRPVATHTWGDAAWLLSYDSSQLTLVSVRAD